jgi:UTP--glucose-1-phosphate uridylyltransferase
LGKRPILFHVAEELTGAGIQRIVLVTSTAKRAIDGIFQTQSQAAKGEQANDHSAQTSQPFHHVEIVVEIQPQQLGLGHAVMCADRAVGRQPFVVALPDSVVISANPSHLLRRMASIFFEQSADVVVAFEEVNLQTVDQFGIAKPKSDGDVFELADIIEKPAVGSAPSNLAVAARYIFTADIFGQLRSIGPGIGGEIQLTDAIRRSIDVGRRVLGVKLTGEERRVEIGSIAAYVRAFVQFALREPDLVDAVTEALAMAPAESIDE